MCEKTQNTNKNSESEKVASSRIPGFYLLTPEERLSALQTSDIINNEQRAVYSSEGLSLEHANAMVENVISTLSLPCAVALNFLVDGVERIVPMVVEEPSVLAAASNMAKVARECGGFRTEMSRSEMIGQIQLMNVTDPNETANRLETAIPRLISIASTVHPRLAGRGGGIRGMEVRKLTYDEPGRVVEQMVVLHFFLDCVDAMGANMINTIAEQLAPHVETITGETVGLKILSNLADRRIATARVTIKPSALKTDQLSGEVVAERIAAAWRFAWADPYRAATHNKGVMNGVDAIAIATGNDWRAIEAGAHAWCCRDGHYRPLTRWEIDSKGLLQGSIDLPSQFGLVGGSIRIHPTVRANLQMLGVKSAKELAGIAAAVGLAQNLGALRALATEGIQAGHMRMHARTIAANAGAMPEEILSVASSLVRDQDFSVAHAETILQQLRWQEEG